MAQKQSGPDFDKARQYEPEKPGKQKNPKSVASEKEKKPAEAAPKDK